FANPLSPMHHIFGPKYKFNNIIYPEWDSPKLNKELTYDDKNTSIQETKYEYELPSVQNIKTLLVDDLGSVFSSFQGYDKFFVNDHRYFIQNNYLTIGSAKLLSKSQKQYYFDNSGSTFNTSISENYSYN